MKWEDLPINLLLQIFKELNPIDHGAVARVCHLWRMTYLDSSLWRIVDLGSLRSNSIWVNTRIRLSQALRNMVTYGRVNIRCIIFHPQLLIKDEHLNLIAQGCPHLKRLVVLRWEVMNKNAMCNAIKNFRDLESMIVPGNTSLHIMKMMSMSCKSFSELKVIGCFPKRFGIRATLYLPGLKVLSLRCCRTSMVAIEMILGGINHLEVLNLSHALVQLEVGSEVMPIAKGFKEMTCKFLLETASTLRSFLYCQDYVSCSECK
ncbi:unnamed protein product, partial [Musa hybrid cultivar]